jgi:hypothetical protein
MQTQLQQKLKERGLEEKQAKKAHELDCYNAYVSYFNSRIKADLFPVQFKAYDRTQLPHQKFYEYDAAAWNRFEYQLRQRFEVRVHIPANEMATVSMEIVGFKES